MELVYTFEERSNLDLQTIFLAGPTYRVKARSKVKESWRQNAVNYLDKYGFTGSVVIPEYRGNKLPENWNLIDQVDWEVSFMRGADLIIFWIPRNMKSLPGLTTNIEFGEYLHSGKIFIGAPSEAVKNEYLIERCRRLHIPWYTDLEELVKTCVTTEV